MSHAQSRGLKQILNRHAALAAERRGLPEAVHRPVHVFLQVASGCNLDCYMCSEHNRPPELRHGVGLVSFSRELYDKLADEVYPYSTMVTFGVGGEPTLSPDFPYFLDRAWRGRQEVHLITNGTRLYRGEIAETTARCASFVQISIDGATKETYERIRKGGRWASLRENLNGFQKLREKQPRSKRTHLTLAIVIMRSNVHELTQYIELAHSYDADLVSVQHCIPVTTEGVEESLTKEPERFNRERERAMTRAKALGVKIDMPDAFAVDPSNPTPPPPPLSFMTASMPTTLTLPAAPPMPEEPPSTATSAAAGMPETHARPVDFNALLGGRVGESEFLPPPLAPLGRAIPCKMPTLDLFVLYDGRVFPCCHPFAHRKMQVGDLRKQSFAEIWNGPLYRSLRAGLRTGDAPLACRTCSLVHDPPPPEDPGAVERSADLAGYFRGRERAPRDAAAARSHAVSLHMPSHGDLARRVGWTRLARDVARGRILRRPEP